MESTLAASYTDLLADVATFLGYTRGVAFGEADWDFRQKANLERCVRGGIRNVYHCGYDWSFLKPVVTLTLSSGANTVPLPDDFGGLEGQIALGATTATVWQPLDVRGIGDLYQQQNLYPTTNGQPLLVAQEPIKGTGPTQGQRFQLRFWPLADQDYRIQFQYYLLPDYLSGALPYVYGGAQHAETFLSSCKAIAERDLDDIIDGPQQIEFMRRLDVSKDLDRRHKPQMLGYNRDHSDSHSEWTRRDVHWNNPVVTFGGATPQ